MQLCTVPCAGQDFSNWLLGDCDLQSSCYCFIQQYCLACRGRFEFTHSTLTGYTLCMVPDTRSWKHRDEWDLGFNMKVLTVWRLCRSSQHTAECAVNSGMERKLGQKSNMWFKEQEHVFQKRPPWRPYFTEMFFLPCLLAVAPVELLLQISMSHSHPTLKGWPESGVTLQLCGFAIL